MLNILGPAARGIGQGLQTARQWEMEQEERERKKAEFDMMMKQARLAMKVSQAQLDMKELEHERMEALGEAAGQQFPVGPGRPAVQAPVGQAGGAAMMGAGAAMPGPMGMGLRIGGQMLGQAPPMTVRPAQQPINLLQHLQAQALARKGDLTPMAEAELGLRPVSDLPELEQERLGRKRTPKEQEAWEAEREDAAVRNRVLQAGVDHNKAMLDLENLKFEHIQEYDKKKWDLASPAQKEEWAHEAALKAYDRQTSLMVAGIRARGRGGRADEGMTAAHGRVMNEIQQTEARLYGGTYFDTILQKTVTVPKTTDPAERERLLARLEWLDQQGASFGLPTRRATGEGSDWTSGTGRRRALADLGPMVFVREGWEQGYDDQQLDAMMAAADPPVSRQKRKAALAQGKKIVPGAYGGAGGPQRAPAM